MKYKYKCLAKHAANNLQIVSASVLVVPLIIQDNIVLAILVAISALIGAVSNTLRAANLELDILQLTAKKG